MHSLLHGVRPTACAVPWQNLLGNSQRVRKCPRCGVLVFSLHGVAEEDALQLLGPECKALFRRRDGTFTRESSVCSPLGLVRGALKISAIAWVGMTVLFSCLGQIGLIMSVACAPCFFIGSFLVAHGWLSKQQLRRQLYAAQQNALWQQSNNDYELSTKLRK